MIDEKFTYFGKMLKKWKYAYYYETPLVSDWLYDEVERMYCEEALKRGIVKNELGELDPKTNTFKLYVGAKKDE